MTTKQQRPKPRNEALMRAMQDKRRGSAASPIPSKKKYTRKSKYREF